MVLYESYACFVQVYPESFCRLHTQSPVLRHRGVVVFCAMACSTVSMNLSHASPHRQYALSTRSTLNNSNAELSVSVVMV
jgi:hypothetical protein